MTLQEIIKNFKERCKNNPRYEEMIKKFKELAAKKAELEKNNADN